MLSMIHRSSSLMHHTSSHDANHRDLLHCVEHNAPLDEHDASEPTLQSITPLQTALCAAHVRSRGHRNWHTVGTVRLMNPKLTVAVNAVPNGCRCGHAQRRDIVVVEKATTVGKKE